MGNVIHADAEIGDDVQLVAVVFYDVTLLDIMPPDQELTVGTDSL